MSWKNIIDKLQRGESITFNPKGNSMTPRIHSGQEVTVDPVTDSCKLEVGDVVLAKVSGKVYLHLLTAIKKEGKKDKFQISNNHGWVNGWTNREHIYGKKRE
jgi:hypothetical protein